MVINTKAYLYTPEEHAAVQGYREALEKISDECTRTDISITHIVGVVSNALSKAEDKGEVYVNGQFHKFSILPPSSNPIATDRTTITPQHANSLDELESWVEESWSTQTMIWIHKDQLLSKIQSLKQPDVSDINVGNMPNNGWISVEDRLPLTNKNVLIFSTDREIGEATKGRMDIDGRYFTVCGMQLFEVTHWQPLPPKP